MSGSQDNLIVKSLTKKSQKKFKKRFSVFLDALHNRRLKNGFEIIVQVLNNAHLTI